MAHIPMVSETPEDPRLIEIFDEVRARWPKVPHLYRILGNAPEMLRAWFDMAWKLRLDAKTPRRLRELIILRVAQILQSSYEWAHHLPMARDAGITAAEIDALSDWRSLASLSPGERAALQLAEDVANGPHASAETMTALKHHFSESETVELVLTASFYICVARFLASMDVDLEADYETPW